jgi:F-box protein 45
VNLLYTKYRYRFLNDENNDVWRLHCIRKLAEEALKSELLSNTPTYKVALWRGLLIHNFLRPNCGRFTTLGTQPTAQGTFM